MVEEECIYVLKRVWRGKAKEDQSILLPRVLGTGTAVLSKA